MPENRRNFNAGQPRSSAAQRAFTLVELIIVIVLIGALAAVSSIFIVQPFQATEDLERRATLTDAADQALDRIGRDARRALPNSLRISSDGTRIEFIPVRVGARYRRLPGGGSAGTFVPARRSGSFDIPGGLLLSGDDITELDDATDGAGIDCAGGIPCLSVYNTGQEDYDAYAGDNIAQITSLAEASLSYDNGGVNTPAFAAHSPNQRFYVFDTVTSYICDLGNQRLIRFTEYGLLPSQPEQSDLSDGRLVANNVTSCEFDYREGTATRRALLTIELALTKEGETVTLLDQVQVPNAP